MLEALAIIIVGLWVASKVKDRQAAQAAKPAPAAQGASAVRVLNIEGAEKFEGARGFLSQFGLNPSDVRDLKVFSGPAKLEALPPRVRGCLSACFEKGDSRGPGVPGLLHRNEPLAPNQSVYFALVERKGSEARIVAFVDNRRAAA